MNGCTAEKKTVAAATETYKVIIVGAGAAGLKCAHELVTRYGLTAPNDFLVLEARDRVGGRIKTTIETRTLDPNQGEIDHADYGDVRHNDGTISFAMDHGAAWVHGTGVLPGDDDDHLSVVHDEQAKSMGVNPILQVLQKEHSTLRAAARARLVPVVPGNPWMRPHAVLHATENLVLYVNGKLEPASPEALRLHYERLHGVAQQVQHLYNVGDGLATIHRPLHGAYYTTATLLNAAGEAARAVRDGEAPLVNGSANNDTANAGAVMMAPFYLHLMECWYGAAARHLQMGAFDKLEAGAADFSGRYTPEGDYPGPHCAVRHGMSSVLPPLLRVVQERVVLEQEVVRIQQHTAGTGVVTVTTQTRQCYQAAMCVVTLPAGVLQHACDHEMFDPALRTRKLQAIAMLQTGAYKKVMLTFDHIFWPIEPAFIGLVHTGNNDDDADICGHVGHYMLLDNLWARRGIPCLEAVLFGQAGQWATHQDTECIRNVVLTFMAACMANRTLHEHCVDCHVTRWEEDPFSRGAYSNQRLGATEAHAQELRCSEWDGHLVLAGEATISEFEGSVHAALMSGDLAARAVADFLKLEENVANGEADLHLGKD